MIYEWITNRLEIEKCSISFREENFSFVCCSLSKETCGDVIRRSSHVWDLVSERSRTTLVGLVRWVCNQHRKIQKPPITSRVVPFISDSPAEDDLIILASERTNAERLKRRDRTWSCLMSDIITVVENNQMEGFKKLLLFTTLTGKLLSFHQNDELLVLK